MSFLDKIGLKKKKSSTSDVPPPPPAPKDAPAQSPTPKQPAPPSQGLPPLPGADEDDAQKQIRDLPTRNQPAPSTNQPPVNQEPAKPKADPAPPPSPAERQTTQAPPAPIRVPQDPPKQQSTPPSQTPPQASKQEQPPLPSQAPGQSQTPSRDQMREVFNDVPPVKGSEKTDKKITDDDIQDFEVDKFVLPEDNQTNQQAPQQPASKPSAQQSQSQPQAPQHSTSNAPVQQSQSQIPNQQVNQDPFSSSAPHQATVSTKQDPLFVDIHTYEDIQKRIGDLKKQVTGAGKHIDGILSEREREDEEFAGFIKELEQIQEDLITIDEDLFEEK